MKEKSNPFGIKREWKRDADALIDRHVIEDIYYLLRDHNFIPPYEQDCTWISPSAHAATHERTLFELDQRRRKGVTEFYASDMLSGNVAKPVETGVAKGNTFAHLRLDARMLPYPEHTADVIWDRKGALWYAAMGILRTRRAKKLINNYERLLKPGGCIVIDNIPLRHTWWPARIVVAQREWRHDPKDALKRAVNLALGQAEVFQSEPSTHTMLRTRTRWSFPWGLRNHINKRFTMHEIGEGKSKILVLKKRPAPTTQNVRGNTSDISKP